MKNAFAGAMLVVGITLCGNAGSSAETLGTMGDVGRAIYDCWKAPAGVEGAVTLSFSFKRDGTLIGKPRATAVNVKGDDKNRDQFIGAAIAAIESCTPLSLSPALADGIGGQVFTMPFSTAGKSAIVAPQ